MPRQIASLRRVLDHRREVQTLDVDTTANGEVGRFDVGNHAAANVSGFGLHIDREFQFIGRPVGAHVEHGVQPVSGCRGQHAPDLRQRRASGRCDLDDRRREVLLDHTINRQRAFGGADGQVVDIQIVVPHRELSREFGQVQLR